MIPEISPVPSAAPLASYETRWFQPGALPPPLEAAFRSAAPWSASGPVDPGPWPEEGRTDIYLAFAPDLGIKTRDEPGVPTRLEFKGRLGERGVVQLAPGVAGAAEDWVKWSYPAEATPPGLLDAIRSGTASIPVSKRRVLRRIRLSPGGDATEVAPDERLERGVQLELTRVERGGAAPALAWTLGFEAFPPGPGMASAVHRALAPFLEALGRVAHGTLVPESSFSYPAWLSGADPR